jgi:hypothetical protein
VATCRAKSSGPAAELSNGASGEPSASAVEDDNSSECIQDSSDSGEASEPIHVAGEPMLSLYAVCCIFTLCFDQHTLDWLKSLGSGNPLQSYQLEAQIPAAGSYRA